MVLKEKYTNIDRVLEALIYQVNDSIEYCKAELGSFRDPEQMFNFLRLATTYHKDPTDIELIQSVPTLFDNNFWGIPGAGDCDCFTVLTLACCYANDWNNNQIVLKGRTHKNPVHIFSNTTIGNETYNLDLTNPYINEIRKYPLTQKIKL